jgi:hypothetical protein
MDMDDEESLQSLGLPTITSDTRYVDTGSMLS